MTERICPICCNEADPLVKKNNIDYWECRSCRTVFCEELDNSGMVGGEFEVERNTNENHLRVGRIDKMIEGAKKEDVKILDFGCGHGYFIEALKKAGYPNVDGYDAYNENYSRLPQRESYHIITATEVFEHFTSPFYEVEVIYRALMPGGAVLIETSFVNIAEQENISVKDFFYIAPQHGHSIIYSHHSLDLLMVGKGFQVTPHFNRHVRKFQKPF